MRTAKVRHNIFLTIYNRHLQSPPRRTNFVKIYRVQQVPTGCLYSRLSEDNMIQRLKQLTITCIIFLIGLDETRDDTVT